jgi:hypothetical protein
MRQLWSLLLVLLLLETAQPSTGVSQTTGLGLVSFPNSGARRAQASFLRGLALLHSFEYTDAGEAFREAQRLDSAFAMAYWGEALTYDHPIWGEHDSTAAREALARLGAPGSGPISGRSKHSTGQAVSRSAARPTSGPWARCTTIIRRTWRPRAFTRSRS